jgi:hypothetical protein
MKNANLFNKIFSGLSGLGVSKYRLLKKGARYFLKKGARYFMFENVSSDLNGLKEFSVGIRPLFSTFSSNPSNRPGHGGPF